MYEKKFGPTYGATIRNFVADPTGTRVLIENERGMEGGAVVELDYVENKHRLSSRA